MKSIWPVFAVSSFVVSFLTSPGEQEVSPRDNRLVRGLPVLPLQRRFLPPRCLRDPASARRWPLPRLPVLPLEVYTPAIVPVALPWPAFAGACEKSGSDTRGGERGFEGTGRLE